MADPRAEESGEPSGEGAAQQGRAAPEDSNVRLSDARANRVDRFYHHRPGPPPTTRIFRNLEEIVEEVAVTGTLRLDWSYLQRVYFHDDSVAKFRAWANSNAISWRLEEYDRGGLERGQTVVFSRKER